MRDHYFHIDFDPERTLQAQIRERLVDLILSGRLTAGSSLPSSRALASTLQVSRNTIVLIYEGLVDDGYLEARDRKGYFVAKRESDCTQSRKNTAEQHYEFSPDWTDRFRIRTSTVRNIVKPNDWQSFEYPFIFGQIQHDFFPLEQWRDATRKSMAGGWNRYWINDMVDSDDPFLIEQIRTRLLPRRGIYAEPNEIIITIGTQNSLYLLANLLFDSQVQVAIENPGFRDANNIFSLFDAKIHKQPVDSQGLVVDEQLLGCDYVFVTPGTQVPTGVELSDERRIALLDLAKNQDMVIFEDDYDAEINIKANPKPALKALDKHNRVIYIGSMSKAISPGLRMGFMVASEDLIAELRGLRRLMYRHPPVNNQRAFGLFLSLGYYDTYMRKIREVHSAKQKQMEASITRYIPEMRTSSDTNPGSTSVWLRAPDAVDTEQLSWAAARKSILIEPGAIHFMNDSPPENFFRLGFSAIDENKIEPGIAALASVFQNLRSS